MRYKYKCENKKCQKKFNYYPNSSYYIEPNNIIKVCNECNDLEIFLRLKKIEKIYG